MTSTVLVLTAAMIAAATGGRLAGGLPGQAIDGFSIDTRTLQPGDLFFAIVAERDGHAFVDEALARGAAGVVVRTGVVPAPGASSSDRPAPVVIEVAETTTALQDLARFVREQSPAKVIAITGSAGKTTTKDTIAAFLSGRYRVTKNQGNLNNHLGLPLSLLALRHGTDVAVMELGMNHAGEISRLVSIARPDVRVWINVGDAHLGHFASPDAIADAKAEILEGATAADLLVCNADDPLVMARVTQFAGRSVTFGTSPHADVRADEIVDRGIDGSTLRLTTAFGAARLEIPLLGRGNVSNVLAAAAVAAALDVPLAEIATRSRDLRPAAHRGAVLRLPEDIVVIDDSYNSSPAALRRALEVIAGERRATRRAAVLGEMLELGMHARRLHEACGRAAAAAGLDRLVVVGGEAAQALAEAAVGAGLGAGTVTWTRTSAEAADLILAWLRSGDLVLVKGSRGVRTDTVVDRITAERG